MKKRLLPTQAELHELLSYDPESGNLIWKARPQKYFNDTPGRSKVWAARQWNSRYSGKDALHSIKGEHLGGRLFGMSVLSHRVIWKMIHGEDPDIIDHINGNPLDNRLSNLRSVSLAENMRNRSKPANSDRRTQGVGQAWWDESKWTARIRGHGKDLWLGSFNSEESAVKARKAAEALYGFHPNHGREGARE